MKIKASIKNGQILASDLQKISDWLKSRKDGDYTFEVKRHFKNRTPNQNRMLWDIYRQVSEQTGYETEEIHAMMGQKFLLNREAKTPYVLSTTQLTTVDFGTFIDKIVRFFSVDAGLIVYKPEDY